MAWRPTRYLIEGELDNTQRGKVTGWMQYAGLEYRMTLELDGEFHRDIRGAKIHFCGNADANTDIREARACMNGFASHQTGRVGNMTAGLPPQDHAPYPYLEWFSDKNGRVVLELRKDQLKVIGTPIPYTQTEPISQEEQTRNMAEYLTNLAEAIDVANKTEKNNGKPPSLQSKPNPPKP